MEKKSPLTRLSGSIAADTEYTILSNYILVTFTSDSALTSSGFNLCFTQNSRTCDEVSFIKQVDKVGVNRKKVTVYWV